MDDVAVDFGIIDIDQHYYEDDDCCTRHLEAKFRDRAIAPRPTPTGEREWGIGPDRHLAFERWVRDITLAPGAMHGAIAAAARGEQPELALTPTAIPEFRDRRTRLTELDGWGIDAAVMLPTLGLAFDGEMDDDPAAAAAASRAFNRWVEDEWGYAYEDRLFAPPFISFMELDAAARELDRVIAAGARMVIVRTGPVLGRSPADPHFDPLWARINEAGIPVALHISTSGYEAAISRIWGEDPAASHRTYSAFQWFTTFATRPVMDTLAAFILHNLFGRFPNLRVYTIENGSIWVPGFLRDIDVAYGFVAGRRDQATWPGGVLTDRPSDIFRSHVYVAPFLTPGFDATVPELIRLLGPDHVVFGSDWPHGEGRTTPLDFLPEFAGLPDSDVRKVLRSNVAKELGLTA